MDIRRLAPLAVVPLLMLPAAAAEANPHTILPTKNTTYTAVVDNPLIKLRIDVVIGKDRHKVKKVTVRESCTNGGGSVVKKWKNLKISESGVFAAPKHQTITTPHIINGFWKSKHKAYLYWHYDDACGAGTYDGIYATD
jgi:hypothetical protein